MAVSYPIRARAVPNFDTDVAPYPWTFLYFVVEKKPFCAPTTPEQPWCIGEVISRSGNIYSQPKNTQRIFRGPDLSLHRRMADESPLCCIFNDVECQSILLSLMKGTALSKVVQRTVEQWEDYCGINGYL